MAIGNRQMDYAKIIEALRVAAQARRDPEATSRSLDQAAQAGKHLAQRIQERSERVERQLASGAHLTRHRISL
jgi:hypothetical protein